MRSILVHGLRGVLDTTLSEVCRWIVAARWFYCGTAEKEQKDKQRSTKHTHKTKDRVAQTGNELRCSGRVGSSCSTSGTRRVNLVTNPVITHERGKNREVFTTNGTYPWSFVTQMFYNLHTSLAAALNE